MKKTIIPFVLLFFIQFLCAQSDTACRKIVDLTIESINNQSPEDLNKYLAEDFSIAGQEGTLVKLVLTQLLSQLNETVKSHNEISQNKEANFLTLKYQIEYEKMGSKEATFVFNQDNLLTELHLFKMTIKTMKEESGIVKSSQSVIEIPFEMAGNLIAIDVMLNGENRKFILDSGAPKVILNAKYFSREDTTSRSISSSKGVSGSISGMNIEKIDSLDFNGIRFIDEELLSLDLSHLEVSLEKKFYGLIGYELIKDYDVLFDYDRKIVTLITPNAFDAYWNKNFPNKEKVAVPFQLEGHIPVIKVEIANQIFQFGIDCGAETNLIDDDLFSVLKKHINNLSMEELNGADNQAKQVKKGEINNLKIGTTIFRNLPTVFSDISHLKEGYRLDIDGLLGYPVLSQQKVLLSFARKELIFVEE